MITDLTIGQYIPGDSIIHKVDPRSKLILALIFTGIIFFAVSLTDYIAITLFSLGLIVLSGISIRYYIKGIKPILFIILLTSIVNIFFLPRGQQVYFWGISISLEGILSSLQIIVRLLVLIIVTNTFIITTRPLLIAQGMDKLMTPLDKIGVPVHDFSLIIVIAIRFVPVLFEETQKIIKAQAARGADFDTGGIITRAKNFVPVLILLFVSAFRRADELAVAMESRCYGSSKKRTSMKELEFSINDLYAMLYIVILGIIVVLL